MCRDGKGGSIKLLAPQQHKVQGGPPVHKAIVDSESVCRVWSSDKWNHPACLQVCNRAKFTIVVAAAVETDMRPVIPYFWAIRGTPMLRERARRFTGTVPRCRRILDSASATRAVPGIGELREAPGYRPALRRCPLKSADDRECRGWVYSEERRCEETLHQPERADVLQDPERPRRRLHGRTGSGCRFSLFPPQWRHKMQQRDAYVRVRKLSHGYFICRRQNAARKRGRQYRLGTRVPPCGSFDGRQQTRRDDGSACMLRRLCAVLASSMLIVTPL
jgi:hypothetical protein